MSFIKRLLPSKNEREVKRIGYIVVSSDRGLCGGLNNNLFRKCGVRNRVELANLFRFDS